jgi:hypothetical protein
MNQEVASLLLIALLVGVPALLHQLNKSTIDLHKRSVKAKCPGCGHTLVITVENLHS